MLTRKIRGRRHWVDATDVVDAVPYGRGCGKNAVHAVFSQTTFVTYFHAALTSLTCNILVYVDLFIQQNDHLFSFYRHF